MIDIDKFMAGLQDYISQALRPLADRVQALESRAPAPGERGEKGDRGTDGQDGKPGDPGADGKSVTLDDVRPLFDAAFATWALEFERRAHEQLQRAVDRMPAPQDGRDGADGRDGLGFDDLVLEQIGERSAVLRFIRGEQVKEFPIALASIIDRGVYKEDTDYERGDAVTWDGSLWIAQEPTGSKPGSKAWRLAVKRGRDGKNGKDGERGAPGDPGPRGRDLTQLGMDGSKW